MSTDDLQKEIEQLRDILRKANKAYYVDSNPIMDDIKYDELFDKLKKIEEIHPELVTEDSPTVRVGSDIINTLPEKNHTIPVLSLDKCYSTEDIMSWIDKTEAKFDQKLDLVIEPKIDGTGVVLYYNNGKLVSALTRGNGFAGNEIAPNIKTIKSVPLTIDYKGELAVRGEVYIEKGDFEQFNSKHADNKYANPRNLASGSVRRQKSNESALFPLKIFLYEGFFKEDKFNKHIDNLKYLKELGFKLNDHIGYFSNTTTIDLPFKEGVSGKISDIESYVTKISDKRNDLPYEIDGLVIKVDDIAMRESLGFTQHHPRWAIAYKFDSPKSVTTVKSITVQVGRGGRITPVANLEPVELAGSTISRATLHNQDYINSLEVNAGDKVTISKRGDVIPAVEEVLEKGENAAPFKMPDNCPECNSELVIDGAHLFCENNECPMRLKGRLKYFVGKNQMDIVSLGEKTIDFLFEKGHVKRIDQIYSFNYDELIDYEGFQDKKIDNIKKSVEDSKNQDFTTVFASLGFKDIGKKAAELIINDYNNIESLLKAVEENNIEKFTSIDGIGEGIAESLIKQLKDPMNIELINNLKKSGLNFSQEKKEALEEGKFTGTKWVVTGSFENFKPRDKAKDVIMELGGEVMSSVSSKTTYLLCGTDAGSKVTKAEKLGIRIINEEEFLSMTK